MSGRIGYSRHNGFVEEVTQQTEHEDSVLFPLYLTEYQPMCICGWVGVPSIASDEFGNYTDADEIAAGEALDAVRAHMGEYV